eukprot:scaffold696_cov163-Ochromonas_danica.AAC.8
MCRTTVNSQTKLSSSPLLSTANLIDMATIKSSVLSFLASSLRDTNQFKLKNSIPFPEMAVSFYYL